MARDDENVAPPSTLDNRHAIETRVRRLAMLLSTTSTSMGEQGAFHAGPSVDAGVRTLREGAVRAERRVASVGHAGSRWLREIEKTLLSELARAAWLSETVCLDAGPEAWPDLFAAAETCRNEVREAAARDPSLFAPVGFDTATVGSVPAPFTDPPGWCVAEAGWMVAMAHGGIPMIVAPWDQGGTRHWLASVGGVGVGHASDAAEAARRAQAAHLALFGGGARLACAASP